MVGTPRATSSAWEGPDRATTRAAGAASAITWVKRLRVASSSPLPALAMMVAGLTTSASRAAVDRMAKEGTAIITRSAPAAQAMLVVSRMDGGTATPGSSFLCSSCRRMAATSSSKGDHRDTVLPY